MVNQVHQYIEFYGEDDKDGGGCDVYDDDGNIWCDKEVGFVKGSKVGPGAEGEDGGGEG